MPVWVWVAQGVKGLPNGRSLSIASICFSRPSGISASFPASFFEATQNSSNLLVLVLPPVIHSDPFRGLASGLGGESVVSPPGPPGATGLGSSAETFAAAKPHKTKSGMVSFIGIHVIEEISWSQAVLGDE